MAIYYIDPHTVTNGTGTYASPFSLSSATRTGLASGDELRIKGVALTSLLTATTYTATYTNNYQITITAGGGLGADWAVGNVLYFPANDTFSYITAVSGNLLTLAVGGGASGIMSWNNTSTGQTALSVRRVDRATYGISSATTLNFIGVAQQNDITVSDCWTSDTTRVTDGTVKSLCTATTPSNCYFSAVSATNASTTTGCVFNLQNTHIVGISPGYICRFYLSSVTIDINQVNIGNGFQFGDFTYASSGFTFTIKSYAGSTNFFNAGNPLNSFTGTINNLYAQNGVNAFTSNIQHAKYSSLTIGNIVYNSSNTTLCQNANAIFPITLNGYIDNYANPTYSSIFSGTTGVELYFGSSFVLYKNRRGSTVTNVATFAEFIDISYSSQNGKISIPTYRIPSSWTASATKYSFSAFQQNAVMSFRYKKPLVILMSCGTTGIPTTINTQSNNYLFTYRDNSSPVEILGVPLTISAGATAIDNFPIVSVDSSTYNVASPSLKCLLTTKNAPYWGVPSAKSYKNILIPVVSGTSYTVTGYIRSNDSAYANGDCVVSVCYNDADLATQSMTTACINAWEQFTLTFTASQTGEAYLAWEMYFANGAKSFWMSDLNIT